jgi:hemolysin D
VESALQVAEEAAYQTELDAAQARMSQVGAEIAAGRATLDSLAQSKAILQEQLNGSSALVAMGAIARDDALRLQRQYIDTSGRLAAQREDMLKLAAERVAAQQGVAQVQARYRRDVLRSLESNTDTRMRLQASNARAQQDLALQWLRSPVDGIVQEVAVSSVGEVVSPGQKVVTVVPKNEPLEVEVDLANQDVAFVRVGQPVQIKVAAFPFEQYGVIPGRVVQISPDAAPSGATGATGSAPAGGLVYRVRVQAERTTLAVHGKPVSMRPGMVVQADIQTGRRTILSFLIDPFKRNLDEGLSVR